MEKARKEHEEKEKFKRQLKNWRNKRVDTIAQTQEKFFTTLRRIDTITEKEIQERVKMNIEANN